MTRLVDVVNFNPDASCLPSARWVAALQGGVDSDLCKWLGLYVELGRRVSLGLIGGAVADMAVLNPEALELVRSNRDVIEIVLRPFAHDVALLRTRTGFDINVRLGREILRREFGEILEFFLPPEFMLTAGQIKQLVDSGVEGVFMNPSRFRDELQSRLPRVPYQVEGVLGARLPCIPFDGTLTQAYLDTLHAFDGTPWTRALRLSDDVRFSWRDGESSFLLPDGLARERAWLDAEPTTVDRAFVREVLPQLDFVRSELLTHECVRAYPVHSFTAWFKELRMLGFVQRVARIEDAVESLGPDQVLLWLQAIGSDVLSAVEKDSPRIELCDRPGTASKAFTIWRSERGFEGEDALALLEGSLQGESPEQFLALSEEPHLRKLRARLEHARRSPFGRVARRS